MIKKLLILASLLISHNIIAQSDLSPFLILDIPFNGNATDVSGNLIDPIEINGPSLCSDRNSNPNSAYQFDGIDDYIRIAHHPLLDFEGSFSVSFWVRLSSDIVGEQERIIGKGLSHTGDVQNWSFTFKGNQTMDYFWEPLDDTNMLTTTVDTLDSQKFYHVVGLIDTQNYETRLYINGELNHLNSTNSQNPAANDYDLLLGVRENYQLGGGFDNYYDGIIDDIKIYTKALDDCEVLSLYNEGTTNYPSLQAIEIAYDSGFLSASLYGAFYQWYLNGELIDGVNTQEIEIFEEGNYQVQVQTGACTSELSEALYVLATEEMKMMPIRVYPNPSTDFVIIDSTHSLNVILLSLYNMEGRIIQVETSNTMIFTKNISKGMYLLKVDLSNGQQVHKQIVIN